MRAGIILTSQFCAVTLVVCLKAHYGAIFASVDGVGGARAIAATDGAGTRVLSLRRSFDRNTFFFQNVLFLSSSSPLGTNVSVLFLTRRRASKLQFATVAGGFSTGSLDFFKHSFLPVHEHVLADDKYQQNQSKQFFLPPLLNTCGKKKAADAFS